jgi:hypothetical protein
MLVDPGTGSYTVDADLRDRMRSTALHNTLVLDGRSQSAPDGPFHWSHTADARVLRWRTERDFDYFVGAHDGYAPAEHRRHVLMRHGDVMIVADFVGGDAAHTAAVHWHVDPRWTAHTIGRRVELTTASDSCQLVAATGNVEQFSADAATGLGWLAPVYGRLEPATTIRVTERATAPFWIATAVGLDPLNAVADVEFLSDGGGAARQPGGVALRIVRERSVDEVRFAEPASGSPARLFFCRTARGHRAPDVLADLRLDQLCAA